MKSVCISFPAFLILEILVSRVIAIPGTSAILEQVLRPREIDDIGGPVKFQPDNNRAHLPRQIGSIIGAYAGLTLLVLTLTLTVGRRLRRAAQESSRTLDMEMVKPNLAAGVTPTTPLDKKQEWPMSAGLTRNNTWGSPKKWGSKHQSTVTQTSIGTFDESVIEEDKAKNQTELERLYAAVMEHDDRITHPPAAVPNSPLAQHPPELQHLRTAPIDRQYMPPHLVSKGPPSPPRIDTTSPRAKYRPSPISVTGPSTTHSRASSRTSLGSFGRKTGIRNLTISSPMGSPDMAPESSRMYSEAEPLSPRFYTPGPPPTPPQQSSQDSYPNQYARHQRSKPINNLPLAHTPPMSPHLPATPRSTRPPRFQFPPQDASVDTISNANDPMNPSWTPQHQPQISLTQPPKSRKPTPLSIRTPGNASLSAPSNSSLPLRSAPLPFRSLAPPNGGERPPSMIKATVLERKVPDINHLRSPHTGVPATPYSPYMPFTPLTPVTPSRLVTRSERKKREKEEGRRVLTREDAVPEEDDMWGDGWR